MAVYRDIDSDVRIGGSLTLPAGSLIIGGVNIINALAGKVDTSRQVGAGTGLTGGGELSSDISLSIDFGTLAGTVAEGNHIHDISGITGLSDALAGKASTTHSHTEYLGVNAQAADSLKLNGQLASYYATASGLSGHINDTTIHKSWGNWDTSTNDLRVNGKSALSHNTTTNKLFLNPGGVFTGGTEIGGTVTVGGNAVWHAGNLSTDNFITTTSPASVVSGFTVKGRAWIGDASNAGSIVIKDSTFQETIHIGGSTIFSETKTKTWLSETGAAKFTGNVSMGSLTVNSNSLVKNLNAEFIGGSKETEFVRTPSIGDITGIGVSRGLTSSQTTPTANQSVIIHPGLVFTDSGRRFEFTSNTSVPMANASSNYDRIDIIFVQGSKVLDTPTGTYIANGSNEGTISAYIGLADRTVPIAPYTSLYNEYPNAIPIAQIYVRANMNGNWTVLDNAITDVRKFAALTSPSDSTIEARRNLNVSGDVTATKYTGSAAGLTSIPVNQFGVNRIAKANLDSNTMYLNDAQTISANKTFSNAANLYFAGGTSYYVNMAGTAKFNALTVDGVVTLSGNQYVSFTNVGVAAPGDDSVGSKIRLYGTHYGLGVDTITVWYESHSNHKFYTNTETSTRTERFRVSPSGIDVYGNATISTNLEVQGELKTGGSNEFPDPLVASKSASDWTGLKSANATLTFDSVQIPAGTDAVGSIKIEAVADDAWASHGSRYSVNPGEWITFSAYVFSTTTGKAAQLYINWLKSDGTNSAITSHSSISFVAPTAWGRFRLTAQAPSDATQFRVRIDNDGGAGSTIYFSAFQLERGRAMTGFKPYSGGAVAGFFSKGIKLGNNAEIHSSYNDTFILKDHANGNVTLSAAGSELYLGYQNTTSVRVSANLTMNGTKIADTTGKLYYQDNDIDGRYLKLGGGTVTGATTFSGGLTSSGTTTLGTTTASNLTSNLGLLLKAGASQDHVYMAFYADSQDQAARSGWIGYGSSGTSHMSISNEMANGNIHILLNGTGKVGIANPSPARKLDVSGDMRVSTTLEVGTGTASTDLIVTSNGTFNWRNTIYSSAAGKVSINKTTNSNHPLDVKTAGDRLGLNIQRGSNTEISGISFQNSDGNYTTHLAMADAGSGKTDLTLYSGLSTSLSSLTERTIFYDVGGMYTGGLISGTRLFAGASKGSTTSITLAIGDATTGFDWASAGNFNIMAASTLVASISASRFNPKVPVLANADISTSGVEGRGFRLWDSDYHKIYMSLSNNSTWGGRVSTAATSDYNMYFRMAGGGTNRGFIFQTNTGSVFQIEDNGRVHGKGGFRTDADVQIGNFQMTYNAGEDSLDFIYVG